MPLFTAQQMQLLLQNGADRKDHVPVVKLFTPDGPATWLISEIDPNDRNVAFGLADLGLGFPELGSIYLPEIEELRGKLGLPVERDNWFEGTHPISVYARVARQASRIVEDLAPYLDTSTGDRAGTEAPTSNRRHTWYRGKDHDVDIDF